MPGRGLRTLRLGTTMMPGRELQALRLGHYNAAGTRASTLASWYCTDVEAQASCSALGITRVAIISLASKV